MKQQPTTQRLYYDYPDRMLFQATVIDLYDEKRILDHYPSLKEKIESLKTEKTKSIYALILDRTLFFPSGGGQKADQGVIETDTITAEVLTTIENFSSSLRKTINPLDWINSPVLPASQKKDVVNETLSEEGEIFHLVDHPIPIGSHITGHLDQGNRKEYQQQHSGQHILSSVAFHSFGWNTLSIHLGERLSTIDFDKKEITRFDLSLLENEANQICRKNLKISSTLYDPERFDLTRLRRKPQKAFKAIRIVEIEHYDLSPCCGVHCSSTALAAPIFVIDQERIKAGTRITFIAGDRAIEHFHKHYRTLQLFSTAFSLPIEKLKSLPAELEEQREIQRKKEMLFTKILIQKIAHEEGWLFDLSPYELLEEETLKELSNQLAKELSLSQKKSLILSPFKEHFHWILLDFSDQSAHRFDLLKNHFAPLAIRGGGKAPRYEGSIKKNEVNQLIDLVKKYSFS